MAKNIQFFELNTGAKIPSVGLGTWQADPGVVGRAVEFAIKLGYRQIDCARAYNNEKEIGLVLKKLFEDGVVKRENLFITSKLWCTDHEPEEVPLALGRTLQDLQLDYVDLYLIHWPVRMKKGSVGFKPENLAPVDILSTWRAMEELQDSGKARAIGVSNFSTKKLGDLLDFARIPPAVNQVECHPSWQQPKLLEFCKSKGVHLSGYSPLGSPGTTWLKSDVLKHPTLLMVAEKLGKTPAQVALRWGLQMGHSVLPKSTHEARIKENLDVYDWSIPEDLFAKFSKIEQARLLRGSSFVHETFGDYRTFEELWDGARIPTVALGTWQADPGVVGQAVEIAIKVGYRHIDCAGGYDNEKEIGSVLKKLFEDGVVKREDLFITSKLRNADQDPEDVSSALEKTLQDLQLDYVDLYLVHWPVRLKKGSVGFKPENLAPVDIPGTWRSMEELYDSGKTRAIGVSNFSTKKLGDLLDVARIPPAVNQVECHPSWQQQKLREFCKSKGVHLSGYSPLGSPGTTWLKGDVLKHPNLLMVAEKLGKTPAQVALRWGLQMCHSVLPKSIHEARIKENLDVFGWSIPDELFAKFFEIEQVGYRHIDCAQIYGNEPEIGSALKKLFEEGVVKRKDLFITSKLWHTEHAPEDVPVAFDRTLRDLQLDYVDLYLIHWPVRLKKGAPAMSPDSVMPLDIPGTWKAMEALYDSGKARAIGVCNFSSKKLGDVLDVARIPPAVNQVECHPIWQQIKLREFCKSKGVHLSAWSPLGSPGTPWIAGNVLKHPVITNAAEKLGKTPAQIALRWGLQMGQSVLPKSTKEERIKENFDVFDWSIPDDLFVKFSEIKQERLVKGEFYVHENGPYKSFEELWDGEV